MPGQHGRPRGHAPGANVGVRETNALGGERIYVGCFNPGIGFVITADRPVRLVVRIDKQDVGALLGQAHAQRQEERG